MTTRRDLERRFQLAKELCDEVLPYARVDWNWKYGEEWDQMRAELDQTEEATKLNLEAVLDRVQDEQMDWVARNFPGRDKWEPLVGAFEEFCEAYDALGNEPEYLDAVADHCIFLLDFCSALGIRATSAIESASAIELTGRPWITNLGKIAHSFLKTRQGIRGHSEKHALVTVVSIGAVFLTLQHELKRMGHVLATVISNTWDQVRERDWVAYPDTGRPPKGTP